MEAKRPRQYDNNRFLQTDNRILFLLPYFYAPFHGVTRKISVIMQVGYSFKIVNVTISKNSTLAIFSIDAVRLVTHTNHCTKAGNDIISRLTSKDMENTPLRSRM